MRHAHCLWTLPRRPEEMGRDLQAVLASGTEVGLLVSMIARPSREEAVSDAYALLDRVGGKARQVHEEFSARSDSVAFTGTLALAEQSGSDWLTPWLWTGAVPFLGAPAIALVGSCDEVAAAIRTYEEVGINQFLFMGWPDIEEMKRFAGEVRPGWKNRTHSFHHETHFPLAAVARRETANMTRAGEGMRRRNRPAGSGTAGGILPARGGMRHHRIADGYWRDETRPDPTLGGPRNGH